MLMMQDSLLADVDPIKLVFETCRSFQEFSTLKLNLEKSQACWIGNKKGSPEEPINCIWPNIKSSAIRDTRHI